MKRKGYEFKEIYHPLVANRQGRGTYLGMTQSSKVLTEGKYTNKTSRITPPKKNNLRS
jgi:hypothetical protein